MSQLDLVPGSIRRPDHGSGERDALDRYYTPLPVARDLVLHLPGVTRSEGRARRSFWAEHPASKVVVLSGRPSFTGAGTDSCAYGFFIWTWDHSGPAQLEVS